MRVYETTFILSPKSDDAAFDRQIKSVTNIIDRNKGKILVEDRWGIRRMAYSINKFNQGFYTRLVFEANNQVLTEMDRFFRMEEPYIRHLTVQFEGSLEESENKETAQKDNYQKRNEKFEKPKPENKPVEKPAVAETHEPEKKTEENSAVEESPEVDKPQNDNSDKPES